MEAHVHRRSGSGGGLSAYLPEPAFQAGFESTGKRTIPDVAWDAMLRLNDGGVSRLLEHLTLVVDHDARLSRIRELVDTLAGDIADKWLRRFHHAQGAVAATDKQSLVKDIVKPLWTRPHLIGDLISLLQPSRDQLRYLYLRTDLEGDGVEGGPPPAPAGAILSSADEIFGDGLPGDPWPTSTQPPPDRAARFARDAMRSWVQQLKDLAEQARAQAYFGLAREQFDDLIDELVTGADRHGLEQAITAVLRRNENLAGTLRQQLASRQVDAVFFVLSAFIDYLEAFELPAETDGFAGAAPPAGGEPDRSRQDTVSLFKPPPPIAPGQVPDLAPDPQPFTMNYVKDWFRALLALAVNNTGHTAGQEIPPDQNRRLGDILDVLKGDAHPPAQTRPPPSSSPAAPLAPSPLVGGVLVGGVGAGDRTPIRPDQ